MALSKNDLRITDSDYFKKPDFTEQPRTYVVDHLDAGDPGRIALRFGMTHDQFKILLKYNSIVDPFEELTSGTQILIPTLTDMLNIKDL